jgi:meso-butanediol dehydrogenase/(S,S)-butanediol dehydrogenase/diacetyl reductase
VADRPAGESWGRFAGRRALVTGAASGIGAATAVRLAGEGATVACVDVDTVGLSATVAAITTAGDHAAPYPLDLLDRDAVRPVVETIAADFGGLDAVCNVAGIGTWGFDADVTLEQWDRILGVNLIGTWLVCQAALPSLVDSQGAIVNTASTAATDATPYQAPYAASKGGVVALTRTLAVNHAVEGVRVNAVAPGPIDTPIVGSFLPPDGADMDLITATILPFGAIGRPEEVAAAIAFLASDDASHVNGHILKVDGGKRA